MSRRDSRATEENSHRRIVSKVTLDQVDGPDFLVPPAANKSNDDSMSYNVSDLDSMLSSQDSL